MLVSYKTIGRNIRSARVKQKLTQEAAAELLKMSALHYGRLERGERAASLEQLAQIAQVLSTPVPVLLNGCVEGETFGREASPGAKLLGEQVAAVANGCSPRAHDLMLALCRTVAQEDKKSIN